MADRDVNILIKARDEASGAFDQAAESAERLRVATSRDSAREGLNSARIQMLRTEVELGNEAAAVELRRLEISRDFAQQRERLHRILKESEGLSADERLGIAGQISGLEDQENRALGAHDAEIAAAAERQRAAIAAAADEQAAMTQASREAVENFREGEQATGRMDKNVAQLARRLIGAGAILTGLTRAADAFRDALILSVKDGSPIGASLAGATENFLKQIPLAGALGESIALLNTEYRETIAAEAEFARQDAQAAERMAKVTAEINARVAAIAALQSAPNRLTLARAGDDEERAQIEHQQRLAAIQEKFADQRQKAQESISEGPLRDQAIEQINQAESSELEAARLEENRRIEQAARERAEAEARLAQEAAEAVANSEREAQQIRAQMRENDLRDAGLTHEAEMAEIRRHGEERAEEIRRQAQQQGQDKSEADRKAIEAAAEEQARLEIALSEQRAQTVERKFKEQQEAEAKEREDAAAKIAEREAAAAARELERAAEKQDAPLRGAGSAIESGRLTFAGSINGGVDPSLGVQQGIEQQTRRNSELLAQIKQTSETTNRLLDQIAQSPLLTATVN